MFFTAGPVEQAITAKHFGVEPDADQQRMAGFGSLAAALDTLASAVAGKAFVAGDRFSDADVYVGSPIHCGMQFGTIATPTAFDTAATGLRHSPPHQPAKEIDHHQPHALPEANSA